jgi:hypothetical protein
LSTGHVNRLPSIPSGAMGSLICAGSW